MTSVAEHRGTQGLPEKVEDPAVLAQVADLVLLLRERSVDRPDDR